MTPVQCAWAKYFKIKFRNKKAPESDLPKRFGSRNASGTTQMHVFKPQLRKLQYFTSQQYIRKTAVRHKPATKVQTAVWHKPISHVGGYNTTQANNTPGRLQYGTSQQHKWKTTVRTRRQPDHGEGSKAQASDKLWDDTKIEQTPSNNDSAHLKTVSPYVSISSAFGLIQVKANVTRNKYRWK